MVIEVNFLNVLRLIALIFSVSLIPPLLASKQSPEDWERKSDLWQAIHLFETGDLKGAAEKFKKYRVGCPIAYPYYEYLCNKGFIKEKPLPHDEIVNYTYMCTNHILPLFKSSCVILKELQKPNRRRRAKNPKRRRRIEDENLSGYNSAKLIEQGRGRGRGKDKNEQATIIHMLCSDPRSILAVDRLSPQLAKEAKFKEIRYHDIALYMRSQLQNHKKTADVLFACYEYFKSRSQDLGRYFLDCATSSGHAQAQAMRGHLSATPEIKAFYYHQSALNGNIYGLNGIAHAFELEIGVTKDLIKAFKYIEQAAQHPKAEGKNLYTLALAYEKGMGTDVNPEAAINYYCMADEKGAEDAAKRVCRLLHQKGEFERAFSYFEKARQAKKLKNTDTLSNLLPEQYEDSYLQKVIDFWSQKATHGHRIVQELLSELILYDEIGSNMFFPQTCCKWLENFVTGTEFPLKSKGQLHCILGAYYKNTTQLYDLAFDHLQISVESDNKLAHLYLAHIYEDGLGRPIDNKKTMGHYAQALECPNKWNSFGRYLMTTDTIPVLRSKFDEKARENFEKCIEHVPQNNKHYVLACYNLGLLYLYKRIGKSEQEQRQGVEKYLRESADLGDKDAQRDLAIYYSKELLIFHEQKGIGKNEQEQREAANRGDKKYIRILPGQTQHLLATLQHIYKVDRVKPLKPNMQFAKQLLHDAVRQNDAKALRALALIKLYQQKSFDKKVLQQSIQWLEQAYGSPELPENEQQDIKNILCALKVLAEQGVIELDAKAITKITDEEVAELKQRLEQMQEYTDLLKEIPTEEDTSDSEESTASEPETKEHSEPEKSAQEVKEENQEVQKSTPKVAKVEKKKEKDDDSTQTITTTTTSTKAAEEDLSEQESPRILSRKERRRQEALQKKNMKWRKVLKLMNIAIKEAGGGSVKAGGGSVKPGKGSGRNIQVGNRKTNVHKPHGRDSSNTEAGRLNSIRKVINPDGTK